MAADTTTERSTPGLTYVTFHSACLDADIRAGVELDDPETLDYQFGPIFAGLTLAEAWMGGCELTQHLQKSTLDVLEVEVCEYLATMAREHADCDADEVFV